MFQRRHNWLNSLSKIVNSDKQMSNDSQLHSIVTKEAQFSQNTSKLHI